MHFEISWHLFLKVKNEPKAMKLLKQFEMNINQNLINIKLERYWKDSTLIEAKFISQYEEEMEIESAVFDVLQRTNEVGYNWSISKPRNIGNEEMVWAFEGICNKSRITGVEWIQSYLRNGLIKHLEY